MVLSEIGETTVILGFPNNIRDCASWTLNFLSQEYDTRIDLIRLKFKKLENIRMINFFPVTVKLDLKAQKLT